MTTVSILLTLAAYVLNPSGTNMVDTGFVINTSDQQYLNVLYQGNDAAWHATFGFRSPDLNQPYQIWDVNLTNSVSRVVDVTLGYPSQMANVIAGNTLILGSVNPAHLWSYNISTGATNYISTGPDRDFVSAALGFDGHGYFGTYFIGYAVEYIPDTDTYKNWGKFDSDVDYGEWTAARSVGGNAGYIFGALNNIGESPNLWYLSIIRKSDTNQTVYWKTTNSAVTIRKGVTEGVWYASQTTNSVTRWWRIDSGTPVLLGETPPTYDAFPGSLNFEPTTWLSSDEWDIESLYAVEEINGSTPQAILRFKPEGEANYTEVLETNNWLTAPGYVGIMEEFSNNLFWSTKRYGPCGYFDGVNIALAGQYKHLSAIDFLKVSNTEAYISGYYQATLRWNPDDPWTRAPLMADYTDPAHNPYTAVQAGGIYHYFLAQANNNKVYIGIHHERTSTGGELGWYDPVTGTNGTDRGTFESYDICDLKPAHGGSKMVYVSSAATGMVFVWDVATESVSTNFAPLGSVVLDKVAEYNTGELVGITGARTFAFTTTGELLWTNSLPGTAWSGSPFYQYDRRLTIGPDGAVWQCAGGDLYRISTTDGSYTNLLRTTNDYNTVFLGADLYLYGGSAGTKVWRVANALRLLGDGKGKPRRNGGHRLGGL